MHIYIYIYTHTYVHLKNLKNHIIKPIIVVIINTITTTNVITISIITVVCLHTHLYAVYAYTHYISGYN